MTNFHAILFDLDGVLVDSKLVVESAWRRWAAESGTPVQELLAVLHGRPARELIRTFAPALDAEAEAARVAGYEMDDAARVSLLPGARSCVDRAARGSWAIATSGSGPLARGRLEAVGLPIPDVLVSADDVTAGKPDPEPYELAARRLGVTAARCVVVEDSPAGVLAGRRAGATVLAVTTTHDAAALTGADHVLSTMIDVDECLASLGL